MPIRPLGFAADLQQALPGETVAADADAVSHRVRRVLDQVEMALLGIDDDLQNDFILLALSLAPVTGPKANGQTFRYQPLNLKLTPARTMLSVKLTELFAATLGFIKSNPQLAELLQVDLPRST